MDEEQATKKRKGGAQKIREKKTKLLKKSASNCKDLKSLFTPIPKQQHSDVANETTTNASLNVDNDGKENISSGQVENLELNVTDTSPSCSFDNKPDEIPSCSTDKALQEHLFLKPSKDDISKCF